MKYLARSARKILRLAKQIGVDECKNALEKGVYCVFGCHTRCTVEYCCKKPQILDISDQLNTTGLYHHLFCALGNVIAKVPQLVDFETNNVAEVCMNILARFNMSKRLNLVQRNSFNERSSLAALRYNHGIKWQAGAAQAILKQKPGHYLNKYISRMACIRGRKVQRRPRHINPCKKLASNEIAYRPDVAEICLTPDQMETEIQRLVARLRVTAEEGARIARDTVGQLENTLYLSERKLRLTTSNFGAAVKQRLTTHCHNLVKSIL